MKYLLVGDPHVQISNLEESSLLFEKIYEIASNKKVDRIVILGDCFHNHDVIRSQVMKFWLDILQKTPVPVIIVTGNHDMPGSKELEGQVSALDAISLVKNVLVIKEPTIMDGYGFIPYIHSSEAFTSSLKDLHTKGCNTFFCHQTFNSARFENGFYAPHGVELETIPEGVFIVSGHIHQTQKIETGKATIWYPGTPRWLTASDANSQKGVWIFDTETKQSELFDSSVFIHPFVKIHVNEGEEIPQIRAERQDRVYVHLTGSALWIKKQKSILPETVRISSTVTEKGAAARNPAKIKLDIYGFLAESYEPTLVSKEDLAKFMKNNLGL